MKKNYLAITFSCTREECVGLLTNFTCAITPHGFGYVRHLLSLFVRLPTHANVGSSIRMIPRNRLNVFESNLSACTL